MSDAFISSAGVRWEQLDAGVRRQILGHDEGVMLVRVDFDAGAVGAVHHHSHRQVTYVVAGSFDVTIDGETRRLETGDSFIVAPHLPHGVLSVERGTLIDVFAPPRLDFLPKG